uniref:Uncharacterized protein n=1 Tax=Onchocerca volvulus TaxID=6282 RepID=A0A2K6VGR8_ONCVO
MKVDKNECTNLKTRQNAFDHCKAILAPMKDQCMALRQCCPSYLRCAKLMMQTNISRKYNDILNRTKEIQSNCEKKIMATLKSFLLLIPKKSFIQIIIHSSFKIIPPSYSF